MKSICRENIVIQEAIQILEGRLRRSAHCFTNPRETKYFLRLKLAEKEHEVFAVIFLDSKHRLITFEEIFRGTIDSASVHPREVVKLVLKYNAVAIILAHNHPSGVATPSSSDKHITNKLKEALNLIDVRVLDHFIIGGTETTSFAEKGLL